MTIYSRKMQAIFHRAQLEAERFESPFLETWHVLLAMVEVPGSVAYLTFTDFEDRIHSEEIECIANRKPSRWHPIASLKRAASR